MNSNLRCRMLLVVLLLYVGVGCAAPTAPNRTASRIAFHRESKRAGKPFRFVVYGDTRDGHAVHRKIVALIMKNSPAFVIQTGDLVHSGSNESLWNIYDEITLDMRKAVPVYPARGNHDYGGSGYAKRMKSPISSGNT